MVFWRISPKARDWGRKADQEEKDGQEAINLRPLYGLTLIATQMRSLGKALRL
jgi:hypothetical protein